MRDIPVTYQNPDASDDLQLAITLVENTPQDEIEKNVRENSAKYKYWLAYRDPQMCSEAVLIGGGGSINDHIEDIQNLQSDGAYIFAMNGASKWARDNGIHVDYQVILDAKEESAGLVDPLADEHLFSSQCHPETLARAGNLTLWHLDREGVDGLLPETTNHYTLVGGDSSVGVCGLCIAYILGFRDLHIFGYDTSYRDGKGHAYQQDMNDTMPTMEVSWAGQKFVVSLAMRFQPEKFLTYSNALKKLGCDFKVYGEGLLQTMYNTDPDSLSEQEKYQLMWMFEAYREVSPGEFAAKFYMENFHPTGRVIDFGCGTGRASIKFKEAGLYPLLIDFADNCRDEEALELPFELKDLTKPINLESEFGYCTDVMEHIPTKDVDDVIKNIMDCSKKVFFQISTVDDLGGDLINATLHHTVKPHKWWLNKFKDYKVEFDRNLEIASAFYVVRK